MEEREQIIEAGSSIEGRNCTYCGESLTAGDAAVLCPRCKSPHHTRCWKENGGCARKGCFQTARAIVDDTPRQRLEDQIPRHQWKWWEITLITVAGLAFLIFGVLGIGRDRTDPALAGKTVIRFMMADNYELRTILDSAIAEYEAEHPHIKISAETVVSMGYEQKLIVLIAAGDPPDIFGLSPERFCTYVENEAFAPLDPYLSGTIAELGLTGEELAMGKVGDTTYGIANPWRQEIFGVWRASEHAAEAAGFLQFLVKKLSEQRPAEKLPPPGMIPANMSPFPTTNREADGNQAVTGDQEEVTDQEAATDQEAEGGSATE